MGNGRWLTKTKLAWTTRRASSLRRVETVDTSVLAQSRGFETED